MSRLRPAGPTAEASPREGFPMLLDSRNFSSSSGWRVLDSNQRRQTPAGLQPAPFGHSGNPPSVPLQSVEKGVGRAALNLSRRAGQDQPASAASPRRAPGSFQADSSERSEPAMSTANRVGGSGGVPPAEDSGGGGRAGRNRSGRAGQSASGASPRRAQRVASGCSRGGEPIEEDSGGGGRAGQDWRASEGSRTPNRLFTKQVLCRLSYASGSLGE
jgi:hypothetical protein